MNPNISVYAACKINGRSWTWGKITLREVPILLGKLILSVDIDAHNFSSLELRVSKRPVKFDESQSGLEGIDMSLAEQVNDSDEAFPGISYGELARLSLDPIWTRYRDHITNPEAGTVPIDVLYEWNAKYGSTKFARLLKQR